MPKDIAGENIDNGTSGSVSEARMAELQKAMTDFLLNVRRLHAEHEQTIRRILKSIDQQKVDAIRDSIKNNYGS